ncbi:hypothetical protein LTS15_002882 [Exophiala xenobiotica]|nr:hypothetical protein LTS15_002882 [Exophiala xenobiotica]
MTHSTFLSEAVRIVEVGPRDGLQNIKSSIPTQKKLELISRLRETGLDTIEITSVVSPRAIPQLADCQALLGDQRTQALIKDQRLRLPVLVPNVKGLEIATRYGVREVAAFVSASEGFSRANINVSVRQGLDRARQVASRAVNDGLAVRGYISCIFADPFDGPTPQKAVLDVVKELLDMGCYEVSLGDTLGVGTASDVKSLLEFLTKNGVPVSKLAGHFHDTYGQAVSNVWQAYLCGVRVFDSSVGGLGGCPFAPGAKGNAATEDLVYLFEQAGIQTGVNLPKLVEVGNWISAQLRKPNDSRAGMALATRFAGPVAVKSELSSAEKNGKPRLAWNLYKETEDLQIYRSGVNLKVVLHRPRSSNTLTTSMIADLTQIFEEAKSDATITRIAITGSGKYFCAGMDLGKGASPVAQSKAASDAQYERLHRLFETIDNAPQVTIACINGPAFGGGVGLAFACDIRIAAESATVTLSEVKLGLCAATISKYVVREWGLAFTREAMLSARPISVMELKSLGLLARVVDDPRLLSDELDLYLGQLKIAGPQASQMSKELVRLGWAHAGDSVQEAGIKGLFDRMMRPNSEAAVGLKAFQLAKRPLDWDQIVLSQSIPKAKL